MDPIYCIREAYGCIRYVGVTHELPEKRLRQHLSEARSSKDENHRLNWLRSLEQTPTIEVIEWVLPSDREEREIYWIALFRDYGHKLVNGTDGGDGFCAGPAHPCFGKPWPPFSLEHRAKLSVAAIGRIKSAETRARISRAKTGKKLSLEHVAKMSAVRMGKKQSPERIAARIGRKRGPYKNAKF